MSVSLNLSDEQYEALIAALSISGKNKSFNNQKDKLISQLPTELKEEVYKVRSSLESFSNLFSIGTNADLFIKKLYVHYTMDQKSFRIDTDQYNAGIISKFFNDNVKLALEVRDKVFPEKGKSKYSLYLNTPLKRCLASAFLYSNMVSNQVLKELIDKVSQSGCPLLERKLLFDMLENEREKYKNDIDLLTLLGDSKMGEVAMMAVTLADKSALPYLINIKNKTAKNFLEKKLGE